MKCPNCGDSTAVDLDTHSGGFSAGESPVKECGKCGLVWRIKLEGNEHVVDVIKKADVSK